MSRWSELGGERERVLWSRVTGAVRLSVMADLGREVLGHSLDLPCPRCGYLVWATYVEVVTQVRLLCPVCRVGIWLVDQTGSAQVAVSQVVDSITELEKTLKGLFK